MFPTVTSQSYIENALSVRAKAAELLYVQVNVEPITFNRGYYTVDCTYFYKITGETFPNAQAITGLAIFDKRVMLFGGSGRVKSFSSDTVSPISWADDLPTGVVESVDPIALHMKLADAECLLTTELEQRSVPEFINAAFPETLITTDTARRWYVTIGQFSIIRLERGTQLLIPAYDYCMPDKECPSTSDDDPCALFGKIRFPVEEFFPPDSGEDCTDYRNLV